MKAFAGSLQGSRVGGYLVISMSILFLKKYYYSNNEKAQNSYIFFVLKKYNV